MLIEQVMTREVSTVGPDTPVSGVLRVLAERRISCVVVAVDNEPIGVITERDVVRECHEATTRRGRPQTAGELMSAPPLTVSAGTEVRDAMAVARARGVRHVAVVDDALKLTGIVTQTDLLDGHRTELERKTDQLAHQTRVLLAFREELEELSIEDPALKVGNRRAMEIVLEHTHDSATRYRRNYSVVLFGLDHLDGHRSAYGEEATEQLLGDVTSRLSGQIRRSDQIYRLGPDLFLALLPEASLRGALLVAERSKTSLSDLVCAPSGSDAAPIGIRVGMASFEGEQQASPQDWQNVLTRAEYAMSRAETLN